MPISSIELSNSSGSPVIVQATPRCYLAAPALADILNEQMSYLLAHAGHDKADCVDCLRLAQVVRLLMRPFEERPVNL